MCIPQREDPRRHPHGEWGWFRHWLKWHHGHDHATNPGIGVGHDPCHRFDRGDQNDNDQGGHFFHHDNKGGHEARSVATRMIDFSSSGPTGGALTLLAAALSLFFVSTIAPRRRHRS
jgi:hypothetical protein